MTQESTANGRSDRRIIVGSVDLDLLLTLAKIAVLVLPLLV